jgi:hypothetical protein
MDNLKAVLDEPKLPPGVVRSVMSFEILASAKQGCRLCFGSGVFSMTDNPKTPTHEEICGCAVKRFLKFHGQDVVVNQKGEFFWREGRDPLADAIAAAKAASATPTKESTDGATIASGTGSEEVLVRDP